jgi:acyl carrier protein
MNPSPIINSIIADSFDLDEENINGDLSPENTGNWDSMAHLTLVTAIESEFAIKLTMDEIQSIKCVNDIYVTVQRHLDEK